MEINYHIGEPTTKELKKLQSNYAAFNKLMANMQLCGVFSDKLIVRVYSLAWEALDVRIKKQKGELEIEKADEILDKLYYEFQGLFDAYNIFSPLFKSMCFGLFHTLCFYSEQKNK